MMAKVGSFASTSWRIFSDRDLADIRCRVAIEAMLRIDVTILKGDRSFEDKIRPNGMKGTTG